MTRTLLLFLSRRRALRRWIETSHISRTVTKRFIAGLTLDEALEVCRRLHAEGLLTTIDRLGENVTSLDESAGSLSGYLEVLGRIHDCALPSTVSIKLTQFGLDFSTEACYENVRALVCKAKDIGAMVEIDMESSDYTDRTLDIVERLHGQTGCVRAVVQAYLRRTRADIERLNALKIPVRLCKGAYDEPHSVAFATKKEVDRSYVELSRLLLDGGVNPALATHDDAMVNAALAHIRSSNLPPEGFEFQMLYGIRRDLQRKLAAQGCRVRLYVPFGEAWYPYYMRRLAERPANLYFVVRNLLRA